MAEEIKKVETPKVNANEDPFATALDSMENRRAFVKKALEPAEKAKDELEKATATDEVRLQGTKEPKIPSLKPFTESRKLNEIMVDKLKDFVARTKKDFPELVSETQKELDGNTTKGADFATLSVFFSKLLDKAFDKWDDASVLFADDESRQPMPESVLKQFAVACFDIKNLNPLLDLGIWEGFEFIQNFNDEPSEEDYAQFRKDCASFFDNNGEGEEEEESEPEKSEVGKRLHEIFLFLNDNIYEPRNGGGSEAELAKQFEKELNGFKKELSEIESKGVEEADKADLQNIKGQVNSLLSRIEKKESLTEAPDKDGIETDDEIEAELAKRRAELEKEFADRKAKAAGQRKERDDKEAAEKAAKEKGEKAFAELGEHPTNDELFDYFVPGSGVADTLGGELVRAINFIGYRSMNDGDRFWDLNSGAGDNIARSVCFILDKLSEFDEDTFGVGKKFDKLGEDYFRNHDEPWDMSKSQQSAWEKYNDELEEFVNGDFLELLLAHKEWFAIPNKDDSRSWSLDRCEDEGWEHYFEPKFEYELEVPESITRYYDSGDIDVWDVIEEVKSVLYDLNFRSEDVEVSTPWGHYDDSITIEGLTDSDYETLDEEADTFFDNYADELLSKYGEPDDREDDEEEDEDTDESLKYAKNRKELTEMLEKAEGKEYKISRSKKEGYRYRVQFRTLTEEKGEETATETKVEPINEAKDKETKFIKRINDTKRLEKEEEGFGLFGIGDVNVNLDASGQNNAVGWGGGSAKTEDINITNNDSPGREDNRTITNPAQEPEKPEEQTEEGLLSGVANVIGGVGDVVKDIPIAGPILASEEGEKESEPSKPLDEAKIIMDLSDYTPWSGAVDTWDKIVEADKVDELDFWLEDLYPDGIGQTELNDLLWFDADYVLEMLGIEQEVEKDEDED